MTDQIKYPANEPRAGGPLARAVANGVIARIVSGEWGPGAALPSEPDLGAEFGVSQGTARKALMELERRGVVERRQGRGTFVKVRTPESDLFHFLRLRAPDGAPATPALEEETVIRRPATAEEAAALTGAPAEIWEITRVRSLSGRRALHERSVSPTALFPGLAERSPLPNALYAMWQQAYGCAIVRADERLRVGAAGAAARALRVAPETPALLVERRAVDIAERVVELRRSVYLMDGFSYDVSLG